MNIRKTGMDKLYERYQTYQKNIKDTQDSIAEKQQELEGILVQMQEAAVADDMVLYQQLNIKASTLQTLLNGKKDRLSGLPKKIPYEEVAEAWAEYTSAVEPPFEKAVKELMEISSNLLDKYKALVDMQEAVLNRRTIACEMTGMEFNAYSGELASRFPTSPVDPNVEKVRQALCKIYSGDGNTAVAQMLLASYSSFFPLHR